VHVILTILAVAELVIEIIVHWVIFKRFNANPRCYWREESVIFGLPLLDLMSKCFRVVQVLHLIDSVYTLYLFKFIFKVRKAICYMSFCQ
jgi:hypothetical protein